MQEFINLVFNFFKDIYTSIVNFFTNSGESTFLANFIDKNIFNGTLINIGLTWNELLRILLPSITIFFFIYFIFKLVLKVFGLFRV